MKKIIINDNPWQIRIAIIWDGKLQNIYFSAPTHQVLERAFFKGVVTKVLPGIQTAFVDIGQERAGFLHISEIEHRRLEKVEEVLKEGDIIEVKLIAVDEKNGKLKLSRKALLPKPEKKDSE